MRTSTLHPRLVEHIPDQLEDGVLHISERFRTCSHRCCCGCGEEVVTPLSPAEWTLTMDGSTTSLRPSIGNWDYACRSHYVIRRNQVLWAKPMTAGQIAGLQRRDRIDLERLVMLENRQKVERRLPQAGVGPSLPRRGVSGGLWIWLQKFLGRSR